MRRDQLSASVWVRLAKCYGLVIREVRRRGVGEGLTLPQFDALAQLLRARDGMSPTGLSRALLVTAGNVTGLVARLRARGLVAREADPHDRRAAVLRLTKPGRRVAVSEVARQERILREVLGPLPGSRQAQLKSALEDLRRALDEESSRRTRRSPCGSVPSGRPVRLRVTRRMGARRRAGSASTGGLSAAAGPAAPTEPGLASRGASRGPLARERRTS